MGGLEPPSSYFLHLPLKDRALPTELHDQVPSGYPAGMMLYYTPASLRHPGSHYRDVCRCDYSLLIINSNSMSRLLVTIQHLLTLSTHPLSLTLLPICFSVGCGLTATIRPTREPYRFGTYLVALVVLTEKPSLSTPQFVGLFRCCLFAGFIMSIVCLLAGIVASRPSAFVAVTGLEPVLMVSLDAGCSIYQSFTAASKSYNTILHNPLNLM